MKIDRTTKFLMIVFTVAVLLNGINLWIQPPNVGAKELTTISDNNNGSDCSSAGNNSINSPEAVINLERLLGYIESSVNDIHLTVKGIDRKLDALPSLKSANRS